MSDDLEAMLETDRYVIDGKELGRGCWGRVIRAQDKHGQLYALKILDPSELAQAQMEARGLDETKAMRKEEGALAPCSNVVPRRLEFDNKGRPFIAMPVYLEFLSHEIPDSYFKYRKYFNHGLNLDKVLTYLSSLANGIYEMHWKLNRVHGDIKPDNLALDTKGNILLNDLGTSTCASFGWSVSRRDNMGFIDTRAPECFKEGSHPERKADIWAFGSLAYRLFTGKYILEDELANAKDLAVYMEHLAEKINGHTLGDKIVQAKIKKNIPKPFRKLLRDCLGFEDRMNDGEALAHHLKKAANSLSIWNSLKEKAKTLALGIGLPAILTGAFIYAAAKHEPKELTMPNVKPQQIVTNFKEPNYMLADIEKIGLTFEREALELPQVDLGIKADEDYIRLSTNNRYVAYLLKTYDQATKNLKMERNYVTETQAETFTSYTMPEERNNGIEFRISAAEKCIEVAMTKSKMPNGNIDLEDVCAIARMGLDKVDEARRAANSFEFKDYISAKDKDGRFIIPPEEQNFIKTWLAYIKE